MSSGENLLILYTLVIHTPIDALIGLKPNGLLFQVLGRSGVPSSDRANRPLVRIGHWKLRVARGTVKENHAKSKRYIQLNANHILHRAGSRAKQATSALVFGKDVMLHTHGQDKYRRTLADVVLEDGTKVNHELVKQG